MKSLFNFLFAYGHLGWKGRLSRPDHLYHQGRNMLAMLLLSGILVSIVFMFAAIDLKNPTVDSFWIAKLGALVTLGAGMLYLAFQAIRLTILRLHDFNLSGWWIIGLFGLAVADVMADHVLPFVSSFVSLQSLAYLTLLILPGQAIANRFGPADEFTTAGKPRIIRALPVVMFLLVWVMGMVGVFATQALIRQAQQSQQQILQFQQSVKDADAEMQEALNILKNEAEFQKLTQQFGEGKVVGIVSATTTEPSPTELQ